MRRGMMFLLMLVVLPAGCNGQAKMKHYNYVSDKEVTLKAGEQTLFFCSKTDLRIEYNEKSKEVASVNLIADVFRSELFKASKASRVINIPTEEFLKLKPLDPITLNLEGKKHLLTFIQDCLNQGKTMEGAVTAVGQDGFPAAFNLENYQMRNYSQ